MRNSTIKTKFVFLGNCLLKITWSSDNIPNPSYFDNRHRCGQAVYRYRVLNMSCDIASVSLRGCVYVVNINPVNRFTTNMFTPTFYRNKNTVFELKILPIHHKTLYQFNSCRKLSLIWMLPSFPLWFPDTTNAEIISQLLS